MQLAFVDKLLRIKSSFVEAGAARRSCFVNYRGPRSLEICTITERLFDVCEINDNNSDNGNNNIAII